MRILSRMQHLGTRKLYFLINQELPDSQVKIGRDVLLDFLRAEHLLIKPRRSYMKTTNSKHWMKRQPYLISNIKITRPEQLCVSDINYIKTKTGHQHLSLITDAYSKKIMGYELLDNLSTTGPLNALKTVLKNRKYCFELIHRLDWGLQYCSKEYITRPTQENIKTHMS